MATWDTTQLLAEIRDRAQAPSSSSTAPGWQDADLIRRANGELFPVLVPEVLRTHGEHLVTDYSVTMTVGSTSGYRLPPRAAFAKLRDVVRVDADNKTHDLVVLSLEELAGKDLDLSGTPSHYYIKRNKLYLWPVPKEAETLRMSYFRRPNRIVANNTATLGTVSSVSTTTVTLTTTKPGSFVLGARVDFIQATPPFDSLGDDVTLAGASASLLTFSVGVIPSDLAVGDFVCLAGEAPVVQLPPEYFYELAERVARKLLRGVDGPGFEEIGQELGEVAATVASGTRKRNDGEEDIIVGNTFFP